MNDTVTINVENLKNEIIKIENEITEVNKSLRKYENSMNQSDSNLSETKKEIISKLQKKIEGMNQKLFGLKRLLSDFAFNHILTDEEKMREIVDGYKKNTEKFLDSNKEKSVELQKKIESYTKTLDTFSNLPEVKEKQEWDLIPMNRVIHLDPHIGKANDMKNIKNLIKNLNGNNQLMSKIKDIANKYYYPLSGIEELVSECIELLSLGFSDIDKFIDEVLNDKRFSYLKDRSNIHFYSIDSTIVFSIIEQCYDIVNRLEFNSTVDDLVAAELFEDNSKRSDKIYVNAHCDNNRSSLEYYSKEDFIKNFPVKNIPCDIETLISNKCQKKNGNVVDYRYLSASINDYLYAMNTYLYCFFKNKGITTITKESLEQLTPADILILNKAYQLNLVSIKNTLGKDYEKYEKFSIEAKYDIVKSSLKDLRDVEQEKEKVDRNIEKYEQELNYYNNTSIAEIIKGKFPQKIVLDKNTKPISSEVRSCISKIQNILLKFDDNKKLDNIINDFESSELGRLYNNLKGISSLRDIYNSMKSFEDADKSYLREIESHNINIKKWQHCIDNCEQEKQAYESDKNSIIFKNKKNKVVNNSIGRFFFKIFNRNLYFSNMESYKDQIQKFDSELAKLKYDITYFYNQIEYLKKEQQENIQRKEQYITDMKNNKGIIVDDVCKYMEIFDKCFISIDDNPTAKYEKALSQKQGFLQNMESLKNEYKEELEKLSQIPNLPRDIIDEVERLKKVYEETLDVTNNSLNSQSISQQSITYDARLRSYYKDLDPELFDNLYSGNYDFQMTGEEADEILSGRMR